MATPGFEELLKQELGTTVLKKTGRGGGGCISQGLAYETDSGTIFIKFNEKHEAMQMFEGEFESLKSLAATDTVLVPKPIKPIKNPQGGGVLVMEFVDFRGLSTHSGKLGEKMARLHQHNSEMKARNAKSQQSVHGKHENYVSQFGFHIPTCCGYLPQQNAWTESWPDFFAQKIDVNLKLAEKKYGDREASKVWSTLFPNLHKLFSGLSIEPALLHGDLWGGNAGQTDAEPVIFDPASFYGHAEYDLAISTMFGGFGKDFFSAYHKILPKQDGFKDRQDLYCMFHYLNHWNHFGGGYRDSTLGILRSLSKKYAK